tara:strand:+ start:2756 stop:3136 length:381 start_codon:yes stop_codon:yes gene_type:complete
MAVTTKTSNAPLITTMVLDTNVGLAVQTAAETAQNLYYVEISNNQGNQPIYLKMFAANTGVTTSTQHYYQFYCPAGTVCYAYMTDPVSFPNGIMFYGSTNPGVASNSNVLIAPTNRVVVRMGMVAQ